MKVLKIFQETLSFLVTRNTVEKITIFQKCLRAFNQLCVGLSFFLALLFLILFLLLEAESFEDYSDIFYPLYITFTDVCILLIYISRKSKIFALIDNLEDIIEIRE